MSRASLPSRHRNVQKRLHRPAFERLERRELLAFNVLAADVILSGGTYKAQVEFSAAVNAGTVQASDLKVDGVSATGFTAIDTDTYEFALPTLTTGTRALSIAAGAINSASSEAISAFNQNVLYAAAAQYTIKYNPRLQPGNAPLTSAVVGGNVVNYPGGNLDRFDLIWETVAGSGGTQDRFTVQYRPTGSNAAWQSATINSNIDTGTGGRIVQSASVSGLNWNTNYDYRVYQRQGDVVIASYAATYKTRLLQGDTTNFSFAAYGDSANGTSSPTGFRQVQARINTVNPSFAVLLGDNVYDNGTHDQADSRFSPTINPEAAAWMATHVDYLGLGNHDNGNGNGTNAAPELQLYSVPIQVAGINAPATAPTQGLGGANDPTATEHNFSWDYGDVHFVTFDTDKWQTSTKNSAVLNAQLDYVIADLNASTAKWKIVYGHHPVAGTEKPETANDYYYQQVVSRLKAAGVDLFMTGHSHTYAWTYPLTGQDCTSTCVPAYVDRGEYDLFHHDDGLPQLISGVGGRDVRSFDFSVNPFIAAGFSNNSTTSPTGHFAEFGFSLIDVTQDTLTVKYIAADDGAVIDQFVITKEAGPPLPTTITESFQQGTNGYTGASDTYLLQSNPTGNLGGTSPIRVDTVVNTSDPAHGLLKFANLFGNGPGQIPLNVTIKSAVLQLNVTNATQNNVSFYRMLTDWSDTDNWNTYTNGIQANGIEARATADVTPTLGSTGVLNVGVLTSIQAWQADPASNFGWAILPSGSDGLDFDSSEGTTRPKLLITYLENTTEPAPPVAQSDTITATPDTSAIIAVLANDSDPNNDPLSITGTTAPSHGTIVVNADKTITYTPEAAYLGLDTFTYTISDGTGYTAVGTVTIHVALPTVNLVFMMGCEGCPLSCGCGYRGTVDAFMRSNQPDATSTLDVSLTVGDTPHTQTLLRFDDIFGTQGWQIPTGGTISSAKLELRITESGSGVSLHRMLRTWSDTDTWNTLGNGVQIDGVEAVVETDEVAGSVVNGLLTIDVLPSLLAWQADPAKNLGWVLEGLGGDSFSFSSSEGIMPPRLVVGVSTADPIPPGANDDFIQTDKNVGVTIPVLDNDVDLNADTINVLSIGTPAHGTAVLNANNTITYTPAANYTGIDTFTYTISDGKGGTGTADAFVEVLAPATTISFQQNVASYTSTVDTYVLESAANTTEGTAATFKSDTDASGIGNNDDAQALLRFDNLFGSGAGQIPVGATILSASLDLNVTNTSVSPSLLHRMLVAWDGNSTWNSLTTGIQTNDIEAASAIDASGAPTALGLFSLDVTASLQAWAASADPNAANLGWAIIPTGPDGADFSSAEGTTPPKLFVTYRIPPTAPVAVTDNVPTTINTAVTISAAQNDTDANGDTLSVQSVGTPAHGTAVLNANGTITYTPALNYSGSDSFSYVVTDGALTANGTVNVTVNQLPVTITFQQRVNGYSGTVDTYVQATTTPTDQTNVSHASATPLLVDQEFTANANPDDPVHSLLRFSNIFGNGSGQIPSGFVIQSASLQLNISDPGDSLSVHRMLQDWADNVTWVSTGAGIQANGIEASTTPDVTSGTIAANGLINLDVTAALQAWSANPASNFGWAILPTGTGGVDITSSEGATPPKLTVTFYVSSNVGPYAVNDSVNIVKNSVANIPVLANDSDLNNDTLTITNTTTPAHGTIVLNANGTITYTPAINFLGTDSFTYTVSDGQGGTNDATVNISVLAPSATRSFQQGTSGYASAIDTFIRTGLASQATAQTLQLDTADSSSRVIQALMRFDNIFGASLVPTDSTITAATLQLTVTDAGDAINLHRMLAPWAASSTWSSLTNGVTADGAEAVAIADVNTGAVALGTFTINVTSSVQSWVGNPASNLGWAFLPSGTDTVQFRSSDWTTIAERPKLTITYSSPSTPNAPPVANADAATATANTAQVVNVLANDSDPNADYLLIQSVVQPAHGSVVVNPDRTVTYTPTPGYLGADTFTYTLSDGFGGTAQGTVNVTVNPITIVFQQGLNGYAGTVDTLVHQNFPDANNSTAPTLKPDGEDPIGFISQGLLRFGNLFGSGASQIPAGSTIASATLELDVTDAGTQLQLYRMLRTWADTDTWNTLTAGVSRDGVEALSTADVSTAANVPLGTLSLNVLTSLQAWAANPTSNLGWVVHPVSNDGVAYYSAEGTVAPKLTIAYAPSVNAAPTAINLSASAVAENQSDITIGNLSAVDPNTGDTHTFSTSDTRFEIIGNQLRVKAGQPFNFETTPSTQVSITATDSGTPPLSVTQSLTITITNVNEAPTTVGLSANTVAENAAGAIIGNVSGTDPDVGDTLTFTVSDNRFQIVAGQLKLLAGQSLNFETEPNVALTITATDAGNLQKSQAFTIDVTNVNEAPTLISLSPSTVAENQAGVAIGSLSATDPDAGNTHTFTTSDPRFEIVGAQLRLKPGQSLDYETTPTVSVSITATDSGSPPQALTQSVTVTVTNVNEAPTAVQLSSSVVAENAVAAVIGNLTATDPDAGDAQTFTVSDGRFEVIGNVLKLKAGQSLNYETEPSVSLNVTATDSGTLFFVQPLTIAVTNVNEAPTAVHLTGSAVPENSPGAVVGTLTADDVDAGSTFTFSSGDVRFVVSGNQLRLASGVSLDYEAGASFNINITANDNGSPVLGVTQSVTINVGNVNETPTSVQLSNSSVAENAVGAVIGNITVSDPDAGEQFTFSVSDIRFEVVNQKLKLKAGQSLDRETESSVDVSVTATDSGGLSKSNLFTIIVTNVNEPPTAIVLTGNTVLENDAGAIIGTLSATDPDAGSTITFTTTDSRFQVVGNQLRLAPGQSLNYEASPVVSVPITATDNGVPVQALTQSVNVNVQNVNEPPANITLSRTKIFADIDAAWVAQVTVVDPEGPAGLTYFFSDARFEIRAGHLYLKAGSSVALSEVTVPLTIEVHDGAAVLSKTFSLQVEPKPTNWLHAYQWKPLAFDVNVDDSVTPIDALLIINELNATGPRDLPKPPPGTIAPFFFDVSGDDALSPLDALLVINYLNAGGSGEGEAAAADQAFSEDLLPAETSAAARGLTDSQLAALWDSLEARKK